MIKITAVSSPATPPTSHECDRQLPPMARQGLRAAVLPAGPGSLQLRTQGQAEADKLTGFTIAAAEKLTQCSDDVERLAESARAWLAEGQPAKASRDAERALGLDPQNADCWYLLGLAQQDLDRPAAALESLQQACALDPNNQAFGAMHACIEALHEKGRQTGLTRLIAIQHANPADAFIRDLLVSAYLFRAERDWTAVEAASGGAALVRSAAKVLRISGHEDIPPGQYPTTAVHIATATECLERARSLGSDDPELCAGIAELADDVAAVTTRRYKATHGESALGLISAVGGPWMASQGFTPGLFAAVCGAAMIAGSFEPQYRTNRVGLSKRGKTVGDTIVGLARSHQHGGLAYLFALCFFFPFVAAYKFYLNRIEGWTAKANLPPSLSPIPLEEPISSPALAGSPDASGAEYGAAAWPLAAAPARLDLVREAEHATPVRDEDEQPAAAATPAIALPTTDFRLAEVPKDQSVGATAPEPVASIEAEPAPQPSVAAAPPQLASPPSGSTAQAAVAASATGRWQAATLVEPPPATASAAERLRRLLAATASARRLPFLVGSGLLAASLIGTGTWVLLRSQEGSVPADAPLPAKPIAAAPTSATLPAPAPPARPPVSGSPRVLDTATLSFAKAQVRISGIAGEGGVPARQMESFIAEQGGTVSCEPISSGAYLCMTGQGYDLAAAALINGAARVSSDAPREYREMQAQAQAERKGIWR